MWCKELTHWKRLWCWERLKAGGEGGNRGCDSWMASPTRWAWVWPSSGRWWRTGKPGMLQSMGSQRVGRDWVTEQQGYLTTYNTLRYFLFCPIPLDINAFHADYDTVWKSLLWSLSVTCIWPDQNVTSTPRKSCLVMDMHCPDTKGGEWQVPWMCYMQDLIQLLSDDSLLSCFIQPHLFMFLSYLQDVMDPFGETDE